MSYKSKPLLRLYKYENGFEQIAIIDDYEDASFERNIYSAGQFTITINRNIPNAMYFKKGIFVQFGNDPYDFGEIISVTDNVDERGKGGETRTITGYDSRYILKRRIIKNMNDNGKWSMTSTGEICLRSIIRDQCGANAEAKRRLPIFNTIPAGQDSVGQMYSVSEEYNNLYDVCVEIATQSETGWRFRFDSGSLTMECFSGRDLTDEVNFGTEFNSMRDGQLVDSFDSFTNAVYVGGKGQNDDRDIYEGENAIDGNAPSGLDRFECWDDQGEMTVQSEYEAEAMSMLNQYGQTLTLNGNGLAKCPYIYKEQYDVGDTVSMEMDRKKFHTKILAITEHWTKGNYDLNFSFGKPVSTLSSQLHLMLRQIQKASNKDTSTDSVRWYTIPTDTEMPKSDVTFRTIGFIGNVGDGATFKLYLDNEKTGAKTYHIYFKQLGGSGKLTLTTGVAGASNLTMNVGSYVMIVYVDEFGNVSMQGSGTTNTVQSGSTQPVTSDAVYNAIGGSLPVGTVIYYYGLVAPSGWFICDGTDTTGTPDELSTHHPELYALLGNTNVLPDLRGEFLRGAGVNSRTNQGSGGNVGEHQNATVLYPQTEFAHDIWVINPDSYVPNINQSCYEQANSNSYTRQGWTLRPTNTSLNIIIKG